MPIPQSPRPEREVTTVTKQAVTEKFTTFPGKCFRYVDADGYPRHCPKRPVQTGRFTDSTGKTWTVDACEEHAEELKA
jgi:hypothetical protein